MYSSDPNSQTARQHSSGLHKKLLRRSFFLILICTQLAFLINQLQVDTIITAPQPTVQFLTGVMPPDHVILELAVPDPTEQFWTRVTPSDHGISEIFTPEIQYWEEDILAWGEEYGLDPNLIATVMQIESCGYSKAKSAAGALGLFQVMPQHFRDEEEDPYDPDTNAYRGLSWLQRTLKSGGSIEMALAGYNAGIARAKNPYLKWPSETQRYVNWGSKIYQAADLRYVYSSALYDWLSKGGSSLCNKAAAAQQNK
jgi:hypothetical protein